MFAFTTALAILTCILFGLVPAMRATRTDPAAAMKAAGRGLTADRQLRPSAGAGDQPSGALTGAADRRSSVCAQLAQSAGARCGFSARWVADHRYRCIAARLYSGATCRFVPDFNISARQDTMSRARSIRLGGIGLRLPGSLSRDSRSRNLRNIQQSWGILGHYAQRIAEHAVAKRARCANYRRPRRH